MAAAKKPIIKQVQQNPYPPPDQDQADGDNDTFTEIVESEVIGHAYILNNPHIFTIPCSSNFYFPSVIIE